MENAWVFGAVDFTYLLFSLGEEEISFPPTYRYERGSRDTYAWHKQKPTGVSEKYGLREHPSGFRKLAVGHQGSGFLHLLLKLVWLPQKPLKVM